MSDLKRVTGLWRKIGKNGAFYGGTVTETVTIPAGSYLFLFPNAFADDNKNEPAFSVMFGPDKRSKQK